MNNMKMKLYTCEGGKWLNEHGDGFGAWELKDIAKYISTCEELFSFEIDESELIPKEEVVSDFYTHYVNYGVDLEFTKIDKDEISW